MLTADRVESVERVTLPNFVIIGQVFADFSDSQDGGRPLPLIRCACVWTTLKEHLMVLNVVQNLVGIGSIVLKICEFQCYASLS